MKLSSALLLPIWGQLGVALTYSNTIVSIPPTYQFLLPNGYTGNSNYTFVNGTHTSNSSVNSVLEAANVAPFISYDQEFLDILGSDPVVNLAAQKDNAFAFEMGVWVPERNSIWFTSSVAQGKIYPPTLYEFNLGSNKVHKVAASPPVTNPNGGYYFQGKVYIATYPNNETYSGGVVAVDVTTLQTETITNSYFGLRYNGIDDIAWVTNGSSSYMFYSDLNFAYLAYNNLPPLQLPASVYRYDPQTNVVLPVIGRNEINPNGVRVSPDMKTLYVTDSDDLFTAAGAPNTPPSGPANTFWNGPYIYAYDFDENMFPRNRRVFGYARDGIADGIHCDDAGNVWTAEWEGVVVRNPAGKTIGVFNKGFFDTNGTIANFALAGDQVVVLANDQLWTVKVGKTLVSANSPIVN